MVAGLGRSVFDGLGIPERSASVMRDDSPCAVDSLPPERRLLLLSSTASLLPWRNRPLGGIMTG